MAYGSYRFLCKELQTNNTVIRSVILHSEQISPFKHLLLFPINYIALLEMTRRWLCVVTRTLVQI